MNRLWFLSVSLVFLAWFITSCLPPRRPPLVNYDSTVFFNRDVRLNPNGPLYLLPTPDHPEGLYSDTNLLLPRTKEEIAWVIRSVAATNQKARINGGRGRRIRVIGSGHSWSKVAKSTDIQLSLEKYKGVVRVDRDKMEVTVLAGTTLAELNVVLEEHGLAMKILGSISDQTVGGAISTATHGSGIGFGNIASLVTKLELISGEGDILTLSPRDNLDVFKAAQVSVGLLGIISEVTFECEPAFNLQEIRETVSLRDCLENMDALAHSGQHVKYWIDLHTEKCFVHRANRTEKQLGGNANRIVQSIENHLLEFAIHVTSWIPSTTQWVMRFIFDTLPNTLPPYNRVDKSYKVFNIPHYIPVHNEGEIVVGFEDCAAAIREQKKFVLEADIPLNFISEIRFVRSDDIWLSPNYQRDSCHLTLCIHNPSEEKRTRYFFGLYEALRRFKPRVHWGKDFNVKLEELQTVYPKLSKFLAVRERMDPHDMFVSEQLAEALHL